MDTLVLNADGAAYSIIPLSVISWQDAVRLMYLDKVTAIENYSDWVIHSQREAMNVPAIIMTKKYYANTTKVQFTKLNIMYRDDFHCQYCNNEFEGNQLTLDHVHPKSMGGKKSWENIVSACCDCNWKRGNDISIRPKSVPVKPTYYQLVQKRKKYPIYLKHPAWNDYLAWDEHLLRDKPGGAKSQHDSGQSIQKAISNF